MSPEISSYKISHQYEKIKSYLNELEWLQDIGNKVLS